MSEQFEIIETVLHKGIDEVTKLTGTIIKTIVTLLCLGASCTYHLGMKVGEIYYEVNSEITSEETKVHLQPSPSHLPQYLPLHLPVEKIDVVKHSTNNIESYITKNLQNTLAKNYLDMVSYELPRNKRTKKTHTRYNDIGILNEHYPTVIKLGILN